MDNKDSFCGKHDVVCPGGNGTLSISHSGAYYRFELLAPAGGGIVHLYCISGGKAVNIGVPLLSAEMLTLDKRVSRSLLAPLGDKIEHCILAGSADEALSAAAPSAETFSAADDKPFYENNMPYAVQCEQDEEPLFMDNEPAYTDADAPSQPVFSEIEPLAFIGDEAADTDDNAPVFSPLQGAAMKDEPAPAAQPVFSGSQTEWVPADCSLFDGLPENCGALMRVHNGATQVALPIRSNEPFALPSLLRWGMPITINSSRYLLYKTQGRTLTVM